MNKVLSALKSFGKSVAQVVNEIGGMLKNPDYLLVSLGMLYLIFQMVNMLAGWPHITLYQTLVITFLINIYLNVKK